MSRFRDKNAGTNYIAYDHGEDDIDRRGFLRCMAWAGTATLWLLEGGVPRSYSLSQLGGGAGTDAAKQHVLFAQISDSHIGFNKEANKDVTATLQEAVAKLNALPRHPALVLHTGDITQLSKADEFDTADQVLKGLRTERVCYVPGEHDVLNDNGASYLARYGKPLRVKGGGWYSVDHSGVHFIGLVNVLNLRAGGLGSLGNEQLDWLRRDVKGLASSTPIVLFAHIPLWTVYPEWGWGTEDSEQALALLKRFGSVTVLNGHIHQIMQKVEGNVAFHTAMSTAFPQPYRAVTRPDESGAGTAARRARRHERNVSGRSPFPGGRGRDALRRVACCRDGRPRHERPADDLDPALPRAHAEPDWNRQLQLHAADAHGEGRNRRDVDQLRRRAAHHRQHAAEARVVTGARHKSALHQPLRYRGNVRLLLLNPSDNDRTHRGAVIGTRPGALENDDR